MEMKSNILFLQGRIPHGYELHFRPAEPNHVFLNDSLTPMCPVEMAQDLLFGFEWNGEIASTKKSGCYAIETGFEIPVFTITSGKVTGLYVDVCDDDGKGRKSLMIWSGTDKEFLLTMDEYQKVLFK
jgi:hypothetical protein